MAAAQEELKMADQPQGNDQEIEVKLPGNIGGRIRNYDIIVILHALALGIVCFIAYDTSRQIINYLARMERAANTQTCLLTLSQEERLQAFRSGICRYITGNTNGNRE